MVAVKKSLGKELFAKGLEQLIKQKKLPLADNTLNYILKDIPISVNSLYSLVSNIILLLNFIQKTNIFKLSDTEFLIKTNHKESDSKNLPDSASCYSENTIFKSLVSYSDIFINFEKQRYLEIHS